MWSSTLPRSCWSLAPQMFVSSGFLTRPYTHLFLKTSFNMQARKVTVSEAGNMATYTAEKLLVFGPVC